ncbi:hypothetical protein C8Q70DRAFT_1054240 [Cubamyces menziesii]|uniref:Carbohydrate-binding module family 19 domain-containing protein n=1 Tax=Trametes cubensis TaxID=1111947 RepID=A0AAD7TWW7_9APHY|nr:hypothetical protein C8Q70DRAFT_1054240 [Cubamyces menziesii]KAJ8482851.1 hypothetical protein ONZ51_g5071 [Trametes cubensis]
MISTLYTLLMATAALGAPMASLNADTFLQNGRDAQILNTEFANLTASDSCTSGDLACLGTSIAQCVNGTWQTEDCPKSLFCFALPSVREEGTVLSCTSNATALAVINASGATGGLFANSTNDSVDFPTDCDDDEEDDGSDTQSSAASTQTSTTQTASASAPFSTATDTSSQISTSGANGTADATITVTVTAPASASTEFSETTILDPAQASSFLSSIATDTNFSIVTTILPTGTSASVTATATAISSSDSAQSSPFSSKPVGIASNPASSNTVAPTTITLVPRPSSASQSAIAEATAAADSSYY